MVCVEFGPGGWKECFSNEYKGVIYEFFHSIADAVRKKDNKELQWWTEFEVNLDKVDRAFKGLTYKYIEVEPAIVEILGYLAYCAKEYLDENINTVYLE